MSRPAVVHHADIPESELAEGDIAFRRRRLGRAAGARRIGASHYLIPPNARGMPVHVHGDEEEIFYVLGGDGLGYELDGRDADGPAHVYPVTQGDVVVHQPGGAPHTFLAGPNGLELIAFGSGSETSLTFLPRAGMMWAGPRWVPLDLESPFLAEGRAGVLVAPAPDPDAPRPEHVVAVAGLDTGPFPPAELRMAGRAAGAVKAGLNHVILPAGQAGAPSHCHSLEEELFVILEGTGTLRLGAAEHPLLVGDVVARPPATRIPHAITAGPGGLTYLVYGTREPGDAVYYPDDGQVWLAGLGVLIAASPPPRRP